MPQNRIVVSECGTPVVAKQVFGFLVNEKTVLFMSIANRSSLFKVQTLLFCWLFAAFGTTPQSTSTTGRYSTRYPPGIAALKEVKAEHSSDLSDLMSHRSSLGGPKILWTVLLEAHKLRTNKRPDANTCCRDTHGLPNAGGALHRLNFRLCWAMYCSLCALGWPSRTLLPGVAAHNSKRIISMTIDNLSESLHLQRFLKKMHMP